MCLIIRQLPPPISEIETIRRRTFIYLLFLRKSEEKKIYLAGKRARPEPSTEFLMKRNLKFECLFPSCRRPGRQSSASFYQKPEHYLHHIIFMTEQKYPHSKLRIYSSNIHKQDEVF